MSKTLLLISVLLYGCFMKLTAQGSVTFDYGVWNTSDCNAFSNAPTINGSTHKSVLGQPQKSGANGILLNALLPNFGPSIPNGTAFSIGYTLQYMHQYQIKVTARASSDPQLYVFPTTGNTSINNACNGMDPTNSWGGSFLQINGPESEYVYNINMSSSYADKIIIAANPTFGSSPLQQVYIRKITITDVSTNPPFFTLSSNTPARNCGSELGVTYTINNINNTPGVDHYEFRCEPGKWLYNGAPATNITSGTNAISLVPIGCAGPGTVRGVAHFANPAVEVTTNALTLSKLVPTYIINGPANLNNVSGTYNLTTNPISSPPPSTIFVCNALPTWNASPGNLAILTINNNTQVGLTPDNSGIIQANGYVLLKATMYMCEQTVTATKSVKIGPPDGIGHGGRLASKEESGPEEKERLNIQNIYPNPTQGIFTIELNTFNESEEVSAEILSVTGQIVLKKTISGKISALDVSGLAKGNYVVRISNGKDTMTEKVILE